MNKLSTRQAGILLAISMMSLKFVTFPAIYANFAGVNSYIAVAYNLISDLIIIAILLWIAKTNQSKTYMQLIEETFGKFITKIINFLLFVYFLMKAVFLVKGHHNFILETLFTQIPWTNYIIPLLLLMGFLMNKSLRSTGRSAELFFPVIVLAIIITLFIPLREIDITQLLPILDSGIYPVFRASFYASFSTGDFIILIMIMGKIKIEKNTYKKMFTYAAFAAFLVVIFYVVFLSVFGNIAANQTIAIGDLPLFTSFPTNVGRIDWITINLWTITFIFQVGVLLSFSLECFNVAFNLKGKGFGISIILFIILNFSYFLFLHLTKAIEIIITPEFNVFNIIFQVLLVLLIFVSALWQRRKNVKYNKKVFSK